MKSKSFKLFFIIAIIFVCVFNHIQNTTKEKNTVLLNIEALAFGEAGGGTLENCIHGYDDYSGDSFIVDIRCYDCRVYSMNRLHGAGQCLFSSIFNN